MAAAVSVLVLASVAAALLSGGSTDRRDRDAASALVGQVDGLLRSDPRRAALQAAIAERLHPSARSKLAMLSVALSAPNVDRVIQPPGRRTLTAILLPGAIVGTDPDGNVRTWSRQTGALLSTTRSPSPVERLAYVPGNPMVVAADRAGGLALWDFHDPRAPVRNALVESNPRLRGLVALGFNTAGTQILALTNRGRVIRVDAASGQALSEYQVRNSAGRVPWRRGRRALPIAAAEFSLDALEGHSLVLVATRRDGVARVDLDARRGRTVLERAETPGRPTSVAGESGLDGSVVVGTSAGHARWTEDGGATRTLGPAVTAVSIHESSTTVATRRGISLETEDATGGPPRPAGRPTTGLVGGPEGVVAIGADGSIAPLAFEPGLGRTTESTDSTIATFGRSGEVLTSEGIDANHITRLVALRPRDTEESAARPARTRTGRAFEPAPSWWSGDIDASERGWYVNDATLGTEFAAAAGQDPDETAVVLVWDAKTRRPVARLPMSTGGTSGDNPSIATKVLLFPRLRRLVAYNPFQELIVVWSTEDWKQLASLDVGPAAGPVASPDGSTVVIPALSDTQSGTKAGFKRSRLLFFDVARGRLDHEVQTNKTYRVEYAPDGHALATVEEGGLLRILSEDGRRALRRPIPIEDANPRDLAWQPGSSLIAVALQYGGVVLVDSASGAVSGTLSSPPDAHGTALEWSPDGRLLAAANGEAGDDHEEQAPISLWKLNGDALVARMCELAGTDVQPAEWRSWVARDRPFRQLCPAPSPPRARAAPTQAQAAPRSPQVVYRRGRSIAVAARDGRPATVGTTYDPLVQVNFGWSPTGAVAWLAGDVLHTVRPLQAVPLRRPCPCSGAAFDGEQIVALERDGSALLRFPRDAGRPRRVPVRGLPAGPRMIGLAGQRVIASASRALSTTTRAMLFSVDRAGRATRYRARPSGETYGPTAVSPDGTHVAFVSSDGGGVCYGITRVGVLDVSSGRLRSPPMPSGDDVHEVRSLEFSRDGILHAAIAPVGCVHGSPLNDVPQATLYDLSRGRFVAAGRRGFDVQTGRGLIASLTGVTNDPSRGGRLALQAAGQPPVDIASGVTSFAVRP